LAINLSFYIFFIFTPIFIFFFKDKILNTKYPQYNFLIGYLPSLELALVFCFAFTLQKYFILDTYVDTAALLLAFILLSIIAFQKKDFF